MLAYNIKVLCRMNGKIKNFFDCEITKGDCEYMEVVKWMAEELMSLIFQDGANELKKSIMEYINKESDSIKGRYYGLMIQVIKEMLGNRDKTDNDKVYEIAESIRKSIRNSTGGYNEYIQLIQKGLKECGQENLNAEIFAEKLDRSISKDQELCNNILISMNRNIEWSDVRNQKNFETLMKELKRNNILDESQSLKKNNSRNRQYANVWNKNMFLNDYNEKDENRGINIKLKEMYIEDFVPHYKWKNNSYISYDLEKLLNEYILNYNDNKMLLIMGQPGVGKSTLITWMLNKYIDDLHKIYVYKFASDLGNVDWYEKNQSIEEKVVSKILKEINLTYEELNGKTLILDGFDEIAVDGNRTVIINNIYQGLRLLGNVYGFSLIIICRENYIEDNKNIQCDYITLQPFDKSQIQKFCERYIEKNKIGISQATIDNLVLKESIFGIPLILYMTLALNISIDSDGSIVDVYDKIFSLDEGGIYNRCINNKEFGDRHRISAIKEQIHQISRDMAIWIFENEPEKAIIPKEEYEKLCNNKMKDIDYDVQDIYIGNYFSLIRHTDGMEAQEICFIHRSIYEYFVVEAIYVAIEEQMLVLTEENQEKVVGKIAYLLKREKLTFLMIEYLKVKMKKYIIQHHKNDVDMFYNWWENAFKKMLDNGMFYYTDKNIDSFKNIIFEEVICFYNMIAFLRIIYEIARGNSKEYKYILEGADKKSLIKYIKFYSALSDTEKLWDKGLDLSYFDLKDIELVNVKANWWNFNYTNLSDSKFRYIGLMTTNFEGANLSNAIVTNSYISNMDRKEAKMQGYKCKLSQIYEQEKKQGLGEHKMIIYREDRK